MSRSRFVAISLVLDALFVNVGIVGAFLIRFGGHLPIFNFTAYVGLAPIITLVYLSAAWVYGLYEPERSESAWGVARAAFTAATVGTVLTAAVSFFGGPQFASFSRAVILIAWIVEVVLLVGWRLAVLRLTPISWPVQRILIVGTSPVAFELAGELATRGKWGYSVEGFVTRDDADRRALAEGPQPAFPILGDVSDLPRIMRERSIERVMVASPASLREVVEEVALTEETNVRVDVVPELYEIFMGRVDSIVSDIPLMQLTGGSPPGWVRTAKRAGDLVFGLLLLVVLSPVIGVFALISLAAMGRPVFFSQERLGKDMVPFEVAKFRTMVRDAEQLSGPVLAEEDDPRVTPLGRFMRRYRIDELPQLVNIVAGQMSFVGPRPERAFFAERFCAEIPGYRERFRIKPGVTGLAQVSGGYATTPDRKLKYDLIYMYHQSLLMDLQILVETLRVVLTGHGAR
jgi:exopolysaccharide biosynthesis polyprenyl glycosylphosphotransferase